MINKKRAMNLHGCKLCEGFNTALNKQIRTSWCYMVRKLPANVSLNSSHHLRRGRDTQNLNGPLWSKSQPLNNQVKSEQASDFRIYSKGSCRVLFNAHLQVLRYNLVIIVKELYNFKKEMFSLGVLTPFHLYFSHITATWTLFHIQQRTLKTFRH